MKIELDSYRNLSNGSLIPRRVDVWVPEQYKLDEISRYPVLYMHDGQNLFYRRKFILRTWRIAEHVKELSNSGLIPPLIIVGIWNTSNRLGDYLPSKPLQSEKAQIELSNFSKKLNFTIGEQVSDLYLELIVSQIKPMIDKKYRTVPSPESTGIMGSSMGGLISLYAFCEYPQVFGKAGCLSTHWPICGDYLVPYIEKQLPEPTFHRVYFDHGTEGLDKLYHSYQEKIDEVMHRRGYVEGKNWVTKVYPGDDHNEIAWSGRLHVPLLFLFGSS